MNILPKIGGALIVVLMAAIIVTIWIPTIFMFKSLITLIFLVTVIKLIEPKKEQNDWKPF